MKQIVVGCTANRKKQKHFFDGLTTAAERWQGVYGPYQLPVTIKLVPLSDHDDLPYPDRARLHAVLHKRTDDMAAAISGLDRAAVQRIIHLDDFLANSPALLPNSNDHLCEKPRAHKLKAITVDPLEGIWKVIDRRRMLKTVETALGPNKLRNRSNNICESVRALPWTLVPLWKGPGAIRTALHGKIKFPIILKRVLACGTKASHELAIAYDMDGCLAAIKEVFGDQNSFLEHGLDSEGPPLARKNLNEFRNFIIAQEYVANHGGALFKVYAIADNVVVQPRTSVRLSAKRPGGGYYCFDSQGLYRGDEGNHFSFDPVTGCSKATEAIMPSLKLSTSIITDLSRELGLSLIGVDIIYDIRSKKYSVVDINYFPGYKGLTMAYDWILQHVCDLVWQRLEGY